MDSLTSPLENLRNIRRNSGPVGVSGRDVGQRDVTRHNHQYLPSVPTRRSLLLIIRKTKFYPLLNHFKDILVIILIIRNIFLNNATGSIF